MSSNTYTKDSAVKFPQDLEKWPKGMLTKAILNICNAVIEIDGGWEWLATENPPENKGYMFWKHDFITKIGNDETVKNEGHSGASFGQSMRCAQYIAKNGFDKWTEQCKE